jgi:hypothetical protein
MIEAKAAFEGAATGLSLLERLFKMVDSARKDGKRLQIADILHRLPAEGFSLAGDIAQKVEKLRQSFLNAKINLSLSLTALQAQTEWWRYKQYRLVRRFAADTNALKTSIGHLLDDFVALAHCSEAEDLIASSFKQAQEITKNLSSTIQQELPVGKIFDELLDTARRIRSSLGDAQKA